MPSAPRRTTGIWSSLDVGDDEPDVELAFLGKLRLDDDPLRQEPRTGLVVELPVSVHVRVVAV